MTAQIFHLLCEETELKSVCSCIYSSPTECVLCVTYFDRLEMQKRRDYCLCVCIHVRERERERKREREIEVLEKH
jgi:hypothetical protein